jgi:RNA polymerase sigma factor (sigma-70 family)
MIWNLSRAQDIYKVMSNVSSNQVLASGSDPERFVTVVDEHGEAVLRYLTRRVGRDLAEDLAAETFLIAFRERHTYTPTSEARSALPWLYGIATNLLRNHLRSEHRRASVLGRLAAQAVINDDPERIDEALSAAVTVGRVADLITGLTVGERDVLLLVATEGLTYAETALALDVPVGTVRSRLSRVRVQLRQALDTTNTDLRAPEASINRRAE